MNNLIDKQRKAIQKSALISCDIYSNIAATKKDIKEKEKIFNATENESILSDWQKLEDKKKILELAYKINNSHIDDMLKNILALGLKIFYSNDKNKNVPYHYKKVIDGISNIINLPDSSIHYYDLVDDTFCINYCFDTSAKIYINTNDTNFETINNEQINFINSLTNRQLISRAKKTYIKYEKIKSLYAQIGILKTDINNLTKHSFKFDKNIFYLEFCNNKQK